MVVTVERVCEKLAMVTVCTLIFDTYAGFHSSVRALAVTNLCFSDNRSTVSNDFLFAKCVKVERFVIREQIRMEYCG